MRYQGVRTFGLAVPFFLLTGCGPSLTSLTGKVTHGGKPVVWGNVTLIASDNMPYQAMLQNDGTYTIPQIPIGPCKIGVTSPNPDRPKLPTPGGAMPVRGQGTLPRAPAPRQPPPGVSGWFELPHKYGDPMNSGLTGEIKKGEALNVDIP